jgi:hypothetical protein
LILGALAAAGSPSPVRASAPVVSCPVKPAAAPNAKWAFTQTGPPRGRTGRLTASYSHGRGQLHGIAASGTACTSDFVRRLANRDLVLTIFGTAQLSRPTTVGGVLGAQLVLAFKVTRSDDSSCAGGSRGTLTLFGSYNGVKLDSLRLSFSRRCASHDHYYVNGGKTHVVVAINA